MASFDPPFIVDYIIVGGGTAGLVLAARLSENPNVHVLVLESGPDRSKDKLVQSPNTWRALSGSGLDWKVKMAPESCLNNRVLDHPAGRVLGGSSAINGMAYVPPSPDGIDAWAKLGNTDWTWKSLEPYLQKSVTLHVPDRVHEPDSNHDEVDTRQIAANGPVQLSHPTPKKDASRAFSSAWFNALESQGYFYMTELIPEEQTLGTHVMMATIDPASGLRSGADRGYGGLVSSSSNVTILTNFTVRKINFDTGSELDAIATSVEAIKDGKTSLFKASKEIILAAGAFHTPKLLELSGIGQKERLQRCGISIVVESSGVGENLQNHLMCPIRVPLKEPLAAEEFFPGMKAFALVRIETEELNAINAIYEDSFQGPAGQAIRSLIEDPGNATACIILSMAAPGLAVFVPIIAHPLSRGSCHIESSDADAQPTIQAGLGSKEIDLEVLARHVQHCHKLLHSPYLQPFVKESAPDMNVQSIIRDLRNTAQPAHHACGTAAMLPKEMGGVVDQRLVVYGTRNLRVVDASIFPLIPHANPLATVYAVAERAADLIKEDSDRTDP
ncbi:hypothetical protein N7539_001043 [Penicillium diatomitis]|uniref:Glucose-methanol-choline oxidoreductase N-terminal domain-containing protein n=1 Tax=Penicillium diatomitis TaxID=2819901 RepID=A0A9W9XMY2_9EURO|nr:uncharacterized protein N7539_001043 [Penicillium diatomitis]KAJ5495927.1 hypothetical protein N7539_001043 [Penicillium diatomitis]